MADTKSRSSLPFNPIHGDMSQWDGQEWRRLTANKVNGRLPIYNAQSQLMEMRALAPGDVATSVATGWKLIRNTASYNILTADCTTLNVLVEQVSASPTTVNLPPVGTINVQVCVVNAGGGAVTVNAQAGDQMMRPDGVQVVTIVLTSMYAKAHFVADGAGFWVLLNVETALTTDGDMLFRAAGRAARLAPGAANQLLKMTGGLPAWGNVTSADLSDFGEAAQDAVGGALVDSPTIDFTYNDAANQITAAVIPTGAGLFPAWTSYVPLVAPSAGSLGGYTLGACKYLVVGKTMFWNANVTITAVGTGSGAVLISTPFNLVSGAAWGREAAVTGQMLFGTPSGNLIICSTYNNGGTVFTNWGLGMTGVFEVP